MLLQIAQVLPREMQGILACCSPVPPLVKQYLNQIHLIILRARTIPLQSTLDPEAKPFYSMAEYQARHADYDSPLDTQFDVEPHPHAEDSERQDSSMLADGNNSMLEVMDTTTESVSRVHLDPDDSSDSATPNVIQDTSSRSESTGYADVLKFGTLWQEFKPLNQDKLKQISGSFISPYERVGR